MSRETRHRAFLVRWQESEERNHWRALLQDAYSGKQIHFTDKTELMRFLWRALLDANEHPGTRDEDERRGKPM